MAYIQCKYCGTQMSDKSEACPVCGMPVDGTMLIAQATDSTNGVIKVGKKHLNVGAIIEWVKKNKMAVVAIAIFIIVAVLVIAVICSTKSKNEKDNNNSIKTEIKAEEFPDENTVKSIIISYCNAIVNNDFYALENLYAPYVERFQSAYGKDRDYVMDCHKRYDKKFNVSWKYSSIRWDSFVMNKIGNDRVEVNIVEDYIIDCGGTSKLFVLGKRFVLNSKYEILSVYDNQSDKQILDLPQLALISYKFVKDEYANGGNIDDVGTVYGKVDFRKNLYFITLVRKVVTRPSDFNTMMSSGVRTTDYMDYGMGKIGSFDIQGSDYSIEINNYMGECVTLSISVNGNKYEWEDPQYAASISMY